MTQKQFHAQALRASLGTTLEIQADLLFCPFTAPFFFDPGIPLVSVVYDLQYLYYPQFLAQKHAMSALCTAGMLSQQAQRLSHCISDYVRQTVA